VAMHSRAISTSGPYLERRDRPGLRLRAAMQTDPGLRDNNEDAGSVDLEHQVFIVADGIGGRAGGEVASALAVEVVRARLAAARPEILKLAALRRDDSQHMVSALLECAVRGAHYEVSQRGGHARHRFRMGTTLDVVLVVGGEAYLAHVGDGRTYLVRDHKATQLTRDHTMAAAMIAAGGMSIEQALVSPLRTVLSNAIGTSDTVRVDLAQQTLQPGDRLLICTDGLYDYFDAQELARALSCLDPDRAIAELVRAAKGRGGHDNITGVVVEAF